MNLDQIITHTNQAMECLPPRLRQGPNHQFGAFSQPSNSCGLMGLQVSRSFLQGDPGTFRKGTMWLFCQGQSRVPLCLPKKFGYRLGMWKALLFDHAHRADFSAICLLVPARHHWRQSLGPSLATPIHLLQSCQRGECFQLTWKDIHK